MLIKTLYTIYDDIDVSDRGSYDARDLISHVVDADSINEYKADFGKTLLTAYATIDGQSVGIVASQRIRCENGTMSSSLRTLKRADV